MNRRTLLKGGAAAGALGMLGMRRPKKSAAARRVRLIQQELPRYEIVSFFVNDQFVESNGQRWIGTTRDITNNGTIIGETVSGGLMRPTLWDASLVPSYLDMGPFANYNAYGHLVDDAGGAVGYAVPIGSFFDEQAAQVVDYELPTIFWQGGAVDLANSGALGPESFVISVTQGGELLGQLDGLPASWVGGNVTQYEVPDGFVAGAFRSFDDAGNWAGTLFRSIEPYTGGTPFIFTATGEFLIQDVPMGVEPDWIGRLQVFDLRDDGSFCAAMRGIEDVFGSAIRFAGGTQTPIRDHGEGMFIRDANTEGVLVGQALRGGISLPTMWIDDQPIVIADLIVPGPDLLFTEVNAINASGTMVGVAQDSAGMIHHVILRPV